MNGGYIALMAALFSFLLIMSQRLEQRHQRKWRWFIILLAVGLWAVRYHLRTEHVIGVVIALVISFLFWLLIGRYNPVGSSDDSIKVYGMND
jgi:hypothetical protein